MPVSSSTEHWIKPDALKINLNHFGDPDYLQVSLLAGSVVMAFKQDVISYNAAHNYRTWPLQAANTYLETSSAYHVYARLTRSEVNASALVVYDPVLRDIEGREITISENGNETLGESSADYFFVYLGKISGSLDSNGHQIQRYWDIDFRFGTLDTNQYQNEESLGEWSKMFRLNKVTDMIDVLKTFSLAAFKKIFIKDKEIIDIKRSSDSGLDDSDDIIPTSKYVKEETERKFLRKDQDDSTSHSLVVGKNLSVGGNASAQGLVSSGQGFQAGEFVSGAIGVGVYQNADGQWVIETDNLSVRRRFSANEVEIQTTNHIGGQTMLTAARMVVERVEELSDRFRCSFRKKDGDGNVIRNEWKVGDQAFCNTFNLEVQADGTIGNHYYWREVVGISSDEDYHYVELSKDVCASGSSQPKVGDKVVQLGYTKDDDANRQNAIVIAGAGTGSPYIQVFEGISGFELPEPDQIKPGDNRLSGRLTIKAGSKGWENLEGLPDSIQEALNMSEEAKEFVESQEYGKNNLIRNSGFTGDYVTAVLDGGDVLKDGSEMFSPSFTYWTADGASVMDSDESESGKEVMLISGGSLRQRLYYKMIVGESYVFSFKGRGIGSVTFSVGGHTKNFAFNSEEFETYVEKFVAREAKDLLVLEAYQDCFLCELQLERGTLKSAWGISPLDNHSELAKYESLKYMSDAIEKGSSEDFGGLRLANMMLMKNLENRITAGTSGLWLDDNSVAYFAGGDYEQAIRTAMAYMDDPTYQPTADELNNMAKFVVTHGGRAILNDVILRGYIYALGGKFKGTVEATDGKFRGEVEALSGTFNNVAFQSGLIGGFRVSGSGIINQIGESSFDNDAYIRLKNTSEDTEAAIGGNVVPPSTGRKLLARFVNENDKLSQYSSLPNECFEIGAKGAIDNIALSIDGGCIEGLAYRTYTISSISTSNIPKNVTEVLCTNSQVINVYLPSLDVYDDGHVVRVTRTGSEFWLYPFDCYTLNSYQTVSGRTLIYHEGNYYSYSNPISIQSWHTCELVWHRDFSKTINGVEYRGVWILTA